MNYTTCTTSNVRYRGGIIENIPLNLAVSSSMIKSKYGWISDPGLPSIKFEFGATAKNGFHEWVFSTPEERDAEYQRLLTGAKP